MSRKLFSSSETLLKVKAVGAYNSIFPDYSASLENYRQLKKSMCDLEINDNTITIIMDCSWNIVRCLLMKLKQGDLLTDDTASELLTNLQFTAELANTINRKEEVFRSANKLKEPKAI